MYTVSMGEDFKWSLLLVFQPSRIQPSSRSDSNENNTGKGNVTLSIKKLTFCRKCEKNPVDTCRRNKSVRSDNTFKNSYPCLVLGYSKQMQPTTNFQGDYSYGSNKNFRKTFVYNSDSTPRENSVQVSTKSTNLDRKIDKLLVL